MKDELEALQVARSVRIHPDYEETVDMQVDLIPEVTQDEPVATYKDWRDNETRIVTYAIGSDFYKGIYAETRQKAKAHCELTYGKIYEANYVPGRAFFRVAKGVKNV